MFFQSVPFICLPALLCSWVLGVAKPRPSSYTLLGFQRQTVTGAYCIGGSGDVPITLSPGFCPASAFHFLHGLSGKGRLVIWSIHTFKRQRCGYHDLLCTCSVPTGTRIIKGEAIIRLFSAAQGRTGEIEANHMRSYESH